MLAVDLKLGTAHAFDHSRKGDHPRACGFNVPPCHGRRHRRLQLVEVSPLFPLFPDQNRRTHSDQRHQFSNFPICDGNAAVGPVLASMPDFLSRYTVGKAMNHDLASGIVPGLHRPTAIPSVRVADLQCPMVCALGHKSVYPVEAFWSLPVALARFVTFRIEAECNPVRSNSVTPAQETKSPLSFFHDHEINRTCRGRARTQNPGHGKERGEKCSPNHGVAPANAAGSAGRRWSCLTGACMLSSPSTPHVMRSNEPHRSQTACQRRYPSVQALHRQVGAGLASSAADSHFDAASESLLLDRSRSASIRYTRSSCWLPRTSSRYLRATPNSLARRATSASARFPSIVSGVSSVNSSNGPTPASGPSAPLALSSRNAKSG